MQTELQKTERELRIRSYSPKTIKSYLYGLREYFSFKANNYSKLDPENIRDYLLHCEQKQISPQSRNLFLNAIKFYYRNVVKISQKIDIQSAKKPKGLPVVLQRRTFGTSGDKSDAVDARLIVEVLTRKLDDLPKITLQDHSSPMATLEALVVFHDDCIFQTSRLKNQLHLLFHEIEPEYRSRRGSSFSMGSLDAWLKKCGRKVILSDPGNIRHFMVVEKIRQLRRLKRTIRRIDGEMELFVNKVKPNLLTFPGVGITTAGKIITAVKGIDRFRQDSFIKYAGIAPVEKQSGKNRKHKQNKSGNRQLNNAIYTVALTQLRCHPKAKEYFQKKIAEGKTKKHAIRCLMKRVACIIYGLLRTGENYRG